MRFNASPLSLGCKSQFLELATMKYVPLRVGVVKLDHTADRPLLHEYSLNVKALLKNAT